MLQRLISLLLVLIPVLASAQSINFDTPEYKRIVKEDCDDKIFTKYEELASFKISKQAFEDSLTAYLKRNHSFDASGKFAVQFLLTKKSRILDLSKYRGPVPSDGFIKAFLHFSTLWMPAKQNHHEVCAVVKCEIEIRQERLGVTVFQ